MIWDNIGDKYLVLILTWFNYISMYCGVTTKIKAANAKYWVIYCHFPTVDCIKSNFVGKEGCGMSAFCLEFTRYSKQVVHLEII